MDKGSILALMIIILCLSTGIFFLLPKSVGSDVIQNGGGSPIIDHPKTVVNGTQGPQGIQGIRGIPGVNGTNGINGLNGTQGIQGIQGIQGNDGSFINGTSASTYNLYSTHYAEFYNITSPIFVNFITSKIENDFPDIPSISDFWTYGVRTLTNWNQTIINTFSTNLSDIKTHADYIPSNIATLLGYIPSSLSASVSTILTDVGYIPSTLSSDLNDIKTHADYIPSNIATQLDTTISSRAEQNYLIDFRTDVFNRWLNSTKYYTSTRAGYLDDLPDIKTHADYIPSNIATLLGYIPSTLSTSLSTILTDVGYIPSTFTSDLSDIKTHADYIPSDATTQIGLIDDIKAKTDNIGLQPIMSASATVQIDNAIEKTTTQAAYTKIKEVRVLISGTYRCYFDYKSDATHTGFWHLYINGVSYGNEYTGQISVYTTSSTQDIILVAGDYLQVYAKQAAGFTVYAKNLELCGTLGTGVGVSIS